MCPMVHPFRTSGGVAATGEAMMTTVEADGVMLGVEHFGDAAAPLVLFTGGTTMLSWPDALCEALARGGRHVVRYDLRDSGASTTIDPQAPAYTLRDLAADAAALARDLDDRPAHLAGIGVGGMVAQIAALDHPDAFSAVTLVGTRPVAPGPVDDDLPDHHTATMDRLFSRSMPDWSDRAAVAEFAARGAEILGDDPAAARATAARKWDRTPGTEPAVQMANQLGMVFAKLDCTPRWRERLSEPAIPALVVHGRCDPFFPVGNGEALTREIPGARLLCSNAPRRRSRMRPPMRSRRRCSRSSCSVKRRLLDLRPCYSCGHMAIRQETQEAAA
jgi:pimeloyl-ACP methyl ester carboxylesterase